MEIFSSDLYRRGQVLYPSTGPCRVEGWTGMECEEEYDQDESSRAYEYYDVCTWFKRVKRNGV